MRRCWQLCILILFVSAQIRATIFGSITGLIHDPQHRPVQGAKVTVWADNSTWSQTVASDSSGQFRFDSVPLGRYYVKVEAEGFAPQSQRVMLASGSEARLHFPLTIAGPTESVQVSEAGGTINPDSSTSTSIIDRQEIQQTPGSTQTISMAMIRDY